MLSEKNIRNLVHRTKLFAQYYRPYGRTALPGIVYIIDDYKKDHGGLADRLKQILGMYAYCKLKNVEFKLIFNSPFELSHYLCPNYNWLCEDTMSRNIFYTKPVYLGYITEEEQRSRLSDCKKQLHVYANSNWSIYLRDGHYTACDLFFELFKPSALLAQEIERYKQEYKLWDTIVFRFQNLIKDFNEPANVVYKRKMVLNETEIEDLLEKTLNFVKDYASKSPIPVLVTSDSKTFLEKVKLIPNVFTTPGDLVHMNVSTRPTTSFLN